MRKYPTLSSLTLSLTLVNLPNSRKNLESISLRQESNKIITSLPKRDQKSKNLQANVSTKKLAAVSAIEKGKLPRRRKRVKEHALVKTETGEVRFHEEVWEIGKRTKSSLLHHAEMRRYAYLLD